MNALQGDVAALQGKVAALRAQLALIQANRQQLNCKMFNAHCFRLGDPIMPMPNNAGVMFATFPFPATRRDLGQLTVPQLDMLLVHYGLLLIPGQLRETKLNALRALLNLPRPLPEFEDFSCVLSHPFICN